ncbi:MAG: transporter [Gammaproteobacteria bacterium]|nr:transporter [Gammaproteobacteria bacterium]MBK79900.1 transporter [Gammaproteobacteria bacterium]
MGLILAGVTLAVATPCFAESLADAWTIALSRDQRLQAIRTQTSAVEAELAAARSNRLPVFSVDSAFTQLDNSPGVAVGQIALPIPIAIPNAFSNDNFVTANARLSLPIYTSGMISRGIDAAGDALDANRFQEAAFVAEVKLSVAESFVTVLRAQRAVDVATTNAASLEGHRRDVDNLNRRGMVPRNDLLAVEVSLADAQQSELKARNALDVARAAYNRRLGRPLDSPVTLDNVMPSGPSRLSENLETLTVVALEERAELHALDEQASALRHRAEALRARTRPQFAAAIGYTYLENDILTDESFASASVGVTWSPFDGGRSRHAALALSRQAQAVTELHNDAVAQTQLQVRTAWLDLNETRQRLNVTVKALAQAEENLRVAKSRYQNGIGTNTEVLDAETMRTVTRSNHDNAHYDAAIARYRLARAVGVL